MTLSDDDIGRLNARELNRFRVLRALHRHPQSSRPELAEYTGLSRPTVSLLLQELERAGIVEYGSEAEDRPRSGRRPVLVSLVPDAAFAVGLDVGHAHIRAAVCDLAGDILSDEWSPAEVDYAPTESLDLAYELARSTLKDAGVAPDRVIGVGMALAAPVDRATGVVFAEGILPNWRGVQPGAEMQARLGLPVQVENDANLGALGEHVFGAGRGVDDMAYVRLSAGIGLGLILDGRLYGGSIGVAGELGHVHVDDEGLICRCGNRGCLETIASPVAVAQLLERSRREHVTVQQLLDLVEGEDRGARRAVAEAGRAVGEVIATVVNLLNPELILIGGELSAAAASLLDPLRAAVEQFAVVPATDAVRITAGTLGGQAEVLGAAAMILAESPTALARRVGQS